MGGDWVDVRRTSAFMKATASKISDEKLEDAIETCEDPREKFVLLKKWVQQLLHVRYQPGQLLAAEDVQFIVRHLLKYHPNKTKAYVKVQAIKLDWNPEYENTKSLYIIPEKQEEAEKQEEVADEAQGNPKSIGRNDDLDDDNAPFDFSYRKCLRGFAAEHGIEEDDVDAMLLASLFNKKLELGGRGTRQQRQQPSNRRAREGF